MGLGPGIHLAYALCKVYPKKQEKIDLTGFEKVSTVKKGSNFIVDVL